ncbi:unnamed protein product [Trichogramma brassicae]|uniref:Uncharacterized protein n=1 Tax=Trichogramma brassicae TaxID=86971 RepID=A0A6H5ID93_9HYME|nr:unnamed protein product [Trichogramma brassicae]
MSLAAHTHELAPIEQILTDLCNYMSEMLVNGVVLIASRGEKMLRGKHATSGEAVVLRKLCNDSRALARIDLIEISNVARVESSARADFNSSRLARLVTKQRSCIEPRDTLPGISKRLSIWSTDRAPEARSQGQQSVLGREKKTCAAAIREFIKVLHVQRYVYFHKLVGARLLDPARIAYLYNETLRASACRLRLTFVSAAMPKSCCSAAQLPNRLAAPSTR